MQKLVDKHHLAPATVTEMVAIKDLHKASLQRIVVVMRDFSLTASQVGALYAVRDEVSQLKDSVTIAALARLQQAFSLDALDDEGEDLMSLIQRIQDTFPHETAHTGTLIDRVISMQSDYLADGETDAHSPVHIFDLISRDIGDLEYAC